MFYSPTHFFPTKSDLRNQPTAIISYRLTGGGGEVIINVLVFLCYKNYFKKF